ncbi:MAG TPA: aminotransferase class III-fold pyridoxal phosphate-dependent enzyme [Candidatus Micrarchaeia archaeon]|nr:aminotransferase class III-fold pyridoxal phosphate-dependent enzyme [Candidatus Micrarchaeia archaeon]
MTVTTEKAALTAEATVELCRRYTLYDWSVQQDVHPIPVAGAKGVYFWTPDGRRYLDFNSQLMSVSIGHGDPRVAAAIARQAAELAYVSPFFAHAPRALLGQKLVGLLPGDLDQVFFTLGGAEANENAVRMARLYTGRQKVLARYRSYHGATAGAISLTGDPRRWPSEPGIPGVVHVLDPYHGTDRPQDSAETALARLEETIQLEGPDTIAAFILEPVTGTNGILIPPDGYLQGVRTLCDRYGIVMIADEVMTGFGRTGEWFAVNHWNVVPDLLTMAKGITSSYVPLGAVALRRPIVEHFRTHMFPAGLTYNSHPVSCAAALATLEVYEQDDLVGNARRLGAVMTRHHAALRARHPSVGLTRNLGLFGVLELVRSRATMAPLAPFNGSHPAMVELNRFLLEHGLYTMVRWNTVMTNPPLCITEAELAEGFDTLDQALAITDRAVEG